MSFPKFDPKFDFGNILQTVVILILLAPPAFNIVHGQAVSDTAREDTDRRLAAVEGRLSTDETSFNAKLDAINNNVLSMLQAIGRLQGAFNAEHEHHL